VYRLGSPLLNNEVAALFGQEYALVKKAWSMANKLSEDKPTLDQSGYGSRR
jgi:hypothetical protein